MRNPIRAIREAANAYRCEWCRRKVDPDAPGVIEVSGTIHCSQDHLDKTLASASR